MISCKLGEKEYSVEFIAARVLREIEPAIQMYDKLLQISKNIAGDKAVLAHQIALSDALDILVDWFCSIFANQFSPDELYDNYPVDRLMHDIAFALLAVQTQATEILDSFPTN